MKDAHCLEAARETQFLNNGVAVDPDKYQMHDHVVTE